MYCDSHLLPVLLFPFGAICFFLRLYRVVRNKRTRSFVEYLSLLTVFFWSTTDMVDLIFHCLLNCTFMDGIREKIPFFYYFLGVMLNYILMYRKFRLTTFGETRKFKAISKFFITLVVAFGAFVIYWGVVVLKVVDETTEMGHCAEIIPTWTLLLYIVLDLTITCIGLYLFLKPLLTLLNGLQGLECFPDQHLETRNSNNQAFIKVMKWNFWGVFLGQTASYIVVLLILIFGDNSMIRHGWGYIATYLNAFGVNIMFQDHLDILQKIRQIKRQLQKRNNITFDAPAEPYRVRRGMRVHPEVTENTDLFDK